jgi:hypothetical protein
MARLLQHATFKYGLGSPTCHARGQFLIPLRSVVILSPFLLMLGKVRYIILDKVNLARISFKLTAFSDSSVKAMLNGSVVTTAWRVLRLRMEEEASRYGGELRIY